MSTTIEYSPPEMPSHIHSMLESYMKRYVKPFVSSILIIIFFGLLYLLTLFFPEPFYKDHVSVGNITVYADKNIPDEKMKGYIRTAQSRLEKSAIYKKNTKQRIFITNNPILWRYFTNRLYKAGGINYVGFNHTIFLRTCDMENNRLIGPSGKVSGGDRTLDYYMTHEMTHTLEFQSMPAYKYPINTNWVIEGYAEYIAHNSESYDIALNRYLNVPENKGEKYYTRVRTMVSYLLEKEQIKISDLWNKVDSYNEILREAIPKDKPLMNGNI